MALSKGAQAIKRAYEQLEYLSQDEQAREEYDNYIQSKIDMQMKIDYAEEKGKKENTIKIVKNMLKSNLSIKTIMNITGATKKEIEEIKKM